MTSLCSFFRALNPPFKPHSLIKPQLATGLSQIPPSHRNASSNLQAEVILILLNVNVLQAKDIKYVTIKPAIKHVIM